MSPARCVLSHGNPEQPAPVGGRHSGKVGHGHPLLLKSGEPPLIQTRNQPWESCQAQGSVEVQALEEVRAERDRGTLRPDRRVTEYPGLSLVLAPKSHISGNLSDQGKPGLSVMPLADRGLVLSWESWVSQW